MAEMTELHTSHDFVYAAAGVDLVSIDDLIYMWAVLTPLLFFSSGYMASNAVCV